MSALAGKRILVVEDEALIAAMLEDMLIELGATVVGPARSLTEALVAARDETLSAAVLDVNLRGERVDAVAAALRERRVPIVFATGYGQGAQGLAGDAPLIDKPYSPERLAAALTAVLAH